MVFSPETNALTGQGCQGSEALVASRRPDLRRDMALPAGDLGHFPNEFPRRIKPEAGSGHTRIEWGHDSATTARALGLSLAMPSAGRTGRTKLAPGLGQATGLKSARIGCRLNRSPSGPAPIGWAAKPCSLFTGEPNCAMSRLGPFYRLILVVSCNISSTVWITLALEE